MKIFNGRNVLALVLALMSSAGVAGAQQKIGGRDVVTLHREKTGDGSKPEFLSVTVLPGRGMNVFQIMAFVPGKSEVPVLASPTLEQAATLMNGGADDENGTQSFKFGGAFLAPFANRIRGKFEGNDIATEWNGHRLTLVANWQGKNPGAEPHAMHGLILARSVDTVTESPAHNSVTGVIHGGDFGGHWFSKTDLHITVSLSGDAVVATITAKNVGSVDEPVGIGWHPYFNLPSGDRTQARLHVPGDLRAEVNNYDDVFPTGKLDAVKGTPFDFTAAGGAALGKLFLDDNWVDLKKDAEGHSYSEIIDPAAKYGIRITALSKEVNSVQVYAPVAEHFVALEPQFNYGDPFGKEWKGRDTGMVTLKPGQEVTWKVKLELFVPGGK